MSVYNETEILGNFSIGNRLIVGGDAVVQGDITVQGRVNALSTKSYNVGVFDSVSSLQSSYPSSEPDNPPSSYICVPQRGWVAGVLSEDEIRMYRYNGSAWENTGKTIDLNVVMQTSLGNYALKSYVDQRFGQKADVSSLYTKTEVEQLLGQKADVSSLYTKTEVEQLLGLAVGETLRVTYTIEEAGKYELITPEALLRLKLLEIDGVGIRDGSVEMPDGDVTVGVVFKDPYRVPVNAFANTAKIKSLHLPSWTREIGEGAFFGCTNLTTIECESVTPPQISQEVFGDGVDLSEIELRVHGEAQELYSAAEVWGDMNIILI